MKEETREETATVLESIMIMTLSSTAPRDWEGESNTVLPLKIPDVLKKVCRDVAGSMFNNVSENDLLKEIITALIVAGIPVVLEDAVKRKVLEQADEIANRQRN